MRAINAMGGNSILNYLRAKSGSAMCASAFAFYLRRLAANQALPGYELHVKRMQRRPRDLGLSSASPTAGETADSRAQAEAQNCLEAVNCIALSRIERHALSRTRLSRYHEYEIDLCRWSR